MSQKCKDISISDKTTLFVADLYFFFIFYFFIDSAICQSVKYSATIKTVDFTACNITWRGAEHLVNIIKVSWFLSV